MKKNVMQEELKVNGGKCEHTIGLYMSGYELMPVTFNKLKRKVRELNSKMPYVWINFEDYFNRKQVMNLIRFDYCPYCGEKLDWKTMQKEASK